MWNFLHCEIVFWSFLDFYNLNMLEDYKPVILYNVSQFQFGKSYKEVILCSPYCILSGFNMYHLEHMYIISMASDFSVSHACCSDLHT